MQIMVRVIFCGDPDQIISFFCGQLESSTTTSGDTVTDLLCSIFTVSCMNVLHTPTVRYTTVRTPTLHNKDYFMLLGAFM